MTTIKELAEFMSDEVAEMCRRMGMPVSPSGFRLASPMRYAIALSQLGDAARYVSHDQEINVGARPHGTPLEEASTYGHAILQVVALAVARGVDLEKGLEMAMQALREKEWAKREVQMRSTGEHHGTTASWSSVKVPVRGIVSRERGGVYEKTILLLEHARAEHTPLMLSEEVLAVVTEQGGTMCHAGIVCREYLKPCVVGTGALSFKDGDAVEVTPEGTIRLRP